MAFDVPAYPLPAIDAMLTMPRSGADHLARHALQAEEHPLAVDPMMRSQSASVRSMM